MQISEMSTASQKLLLMAFGKHTQLLSVFLLGN